MRAEILKDEEAKAELAKLVNEVGPQYGLKMNFATSIAIPFIIDAALGKLRERGLVLAKLKK
jgi:hypothetical protein